MHETKTGKRREDAAHKILRPKTLISFDVVQAYTLNRTVPGGTGHSDGKHMLQSQPKTETIT